MITHSYTRSHELFSCYIAGFSHHDGSLVLPDLAPGVMLTLASEFDNPYDHDAMALLLDDVMLGYIPSDSNGLLAPFIAFGHDDLFEVVVTQVSPEEHPEKQVRIQVRIKDKKKKKKE